jgi:hypothetical protein
LARSFWDWNINQSLFPVQGYKEKKFSMEAEGEGELETKYDDSKQNIGPLPVSSLYAPSWPPPQLSIILLS